MKWLKVAVIIIVEIAKALQRGYRQGKADVAFAKSNQEAFDRDNSSYENPVDSGANKRV